MKIIKLPGLIDCHVHLREPGSTQKENFKTGSQAAIAGGITSLIDMPNNPLPTTTLKRLKQKIKLAQKKAFCPIHFYFGANNKNYFQFQKNNNYAKGLKVYLDHTTGPLLVKDLKVLEQIFLHWSSTLPILVHAEDSTIAKAISLAYLYNRKLHLCHVSLASEITLIKKAKKKGLKITCEVTPHHLFLTKKDLHKLGSFGMMRPPLRSQKDVNALWANLQYIDCFATDHAPHTKNEKMSNNPPNGVPGLETALPLLLTAVNQKRLKLKDIIEKYYHNPAKIFNISNPPNTHIEIDLTRKWTIDNKKLFTKCGWSPFAGRKVKGMIVRTFIKGKKVYEEEQAF